MAKTNVIRQYNGNRWPAGIIVVDDTTVGLTLGDDTFLDFITLTVKLCTKSTIVRQTEFTLGSRHLVVNLDGTLWLQVEDLLYNLETGEQRLTTSLPSSVEYINDLVALSNWS